MKTFKTSSSTTTTRNWNVGVLLEEIERRRHFQQLFRHLRFEGNRALNSTDRKRQDGHFDNLLGNRMQRTAEKADHFNVLFHHLQHRDIESLHELIADATVLPNTPPAARDPSGLPAASPLELAFSGRCALWCRHSARAIATVSRSCFSHERSRRSRRRRCRVQPTAAC